MIITDDKDFITRSLELFRDDTMREYFASFPNAFAYATKHTGLDIDDPIATKNTLGEFWQAMWEGLPDSSTIRKQPFFLISDLAEYWMNSYEHDHEHTI